MGEITEDAVRKEGFKPDGAQLEKFWALWVKLHGSWNPDQEVYVVDFEVVK